MTTGPEREIDDRIADWVDGRLSDRDRERFTAELRVSQQLRQDLEDYERTVAAVRAALRAPTVTVPIADRVLAAIAAGKQAAGDRSPLRGPAARGGSGLPRRTMLWSLASAAALLGIAVLVNAWQPRTHSTEDVATAHHDAGAAKEKLVTSAEDKQDADLAATGSARGKVETLVGATRQEAQQSLQAESLEAESPKPVAADRPQADPVVRAPGSDDFYLGGTRQRGAEPTSDAAQPGAGGVPPPAAPAALAAVGRGSVAAPSASPTGQPIGPTPPRDAVPDAKRANEQVEAAKDSLAKSSVAPDSSARTEPIGAANPPTTKAAEAKNEGDTNAERGRLGERRREEQEDEKSVADGRPGSRPTGAAIEPGKRDAKILRLLVDTADPASGQASSSSSVATEVLPLVVVQGRAIVAPPTSDAGAPAAERAATGEKAANDSGPARAALLAGFDAFCVAQMQEGGAGADVAAGWLTTPGPLRCRELRVTTSVANSDPASPATPHAKPAAPVAPGSRPTGTQGPGTAASASEPEPVAVSERSWLVEGRKQDLQLLLSRLAAFARASDLSLANGETIVVREPRPADDRGGARTDTPAPSAGATEAEVRLVLRFRRLAR